MGARFFCEYGRIVCIRGRIGAMGSLRGKQDIVVTPVSR